jgi:hypothetical protein
MAKQRLWLAEWGLVLLTAPGSALLAGPPAGDKTGAVATSDVKALADKIDRRLAVRWAAAKVTPVARADDAEFLRRVYLDIAGHIPSVSEARRFLEDNKPDKRQRLVNDLLKGGGYVNHFTNVWRALWMAEADTSFVGRYFVPGFENWLRKELEKNAGYDRIVGEILTVSIAQNNNQFFDFYGNMSDPKPTGFYLSKEAKPENLAAATARMFLGVRLECAQCHDHPFATWKREQFWGLASFFAGIQRQEQGDFVFPTREIADRREMAIPGSDRVVQASFLDGTEPQWKFKVGSRVTLADWVTSPKNPYFARAAVNRMWAHFFGFALTEPVDDLTGSETVAYHPELLDELAREFAAHKFDLKFLIRVLTATQAYQLTSQTTPHNSADPHLFYRMAVKGLTPEQLFDSLVTCLYYQEQKNNQPFFVFDLNSPRAKFLEKFNNRNDKPTEPQTSIIQALALMNSSFVADATNLERSEMLTGVADFPLWGTAQRIETLYLAALARKPRPEETARLVKYVDSAPGTVSAKGFLEGLQSWMDNRKTERKPTGKDQALADVLWALLNSSEFILNH